MREHVAPEIGDDALADGHHQIDIATRWRSASTATTAIITLK